MSKKRHQTGGPNLFEDIGIPNAEKHLIKLSCVFNIDNIMKNRGLKQVEAAGLFGIRQPVINKGNATSPPFTWPE